MALNKGRTCSCEKQKALATQESIVTHLCLQALPNCYGGDLKTAPSDLVSSVLGFFVKEQLTKATTVEWAATGLMAAQALRVLA